ncbi:HAD family hydrolase [Gymnodinialimonas hymeniacidonis]|uniref:HAD family hydrolase n=1 Tax=Gymnodinialimonas hymeniacidonis TaxID=3126508 RepID=UPI0034C6BC54
MTIKALLWDLDGTLVDSEPVHERALVAALQEVGLDPPEDMHARVIGKSADAVYQWLCTCHALTLSMADWGALKLHHYMADIDAVAPVTEALRLWNAAAALGVKQAVVSNSDRLIVNANLDRTRLTKPGFISVTRNDVHLGKPNAEPYLRAASLLDVEPAECAVIEDSVTGASAGLAAGMKTYLIQTQGSRELNGTVALEQYSELYHLLLKDQ